MTAKKKTSTADFSCRTAKAYATEGAAVEWGTTITWGVFGLLRRR